MAIYDRAARSVALERRAEVYSLYIAKAAESFGVTKTRDIYELAISELPSSELAPMCLRYANLERKLGEIDRARAIYMHGAHEVDPSKAAGSADGGAIPLSLSTCRLSIAPLFEYSTEQSTGHTRWIPPRRLARPMEVCAVRFSFRKAQLPVSFLLPLSATPPRRLARPMEVCAVRFSFRKAQLPVSFLLPLSATPPRWLARQMEVGRRFICSAFLLTIAV
jgi:hypothetical protein